MSIAPFEVVIVAIDARDEEVLVEAQRVHDELEKAGVDVLLDNRDERAGVKFKDADLIGAPLRITVSRKGLSEGVLELKPRGSGEIDRIPADGVVIEVVQRVRAAHSSLRR